MQGETVFEISVARALVSTSRHAQSAPPCAPQSAQPNGVKLSPESARWLSPSGHECSAGPPPSKLAPQCAARRYSSEPLRPMGDATPAASCGQPPSQAGAAVPPTSAVLLDARRLEEFLGVDDRSRSLTRELMSLFLVEAAASLRDIDLASASRNCCELARSAHAFKALASNVGAVGVVAICGLLEVHASRGRLSEAREQVWRLHLVWGQTRSVVEAWC